MASRQNWLVQPWFSLKSTTNIPFFPAADYFELMTWESENNGGEKLGKGNPQFNPKYFTYAQPLQLKFMIRILNHWKRSAAVGNMASGCQLYGGTRKVILAAKHFVGVEGRKQARKPPSYPSLKLWPSDPLTGVDTRDAYIAKRYFCNKLDNVFSPRPHETITHHPTLAPISILNSSRE